MSNILSIYKYWQLNHCAIRKWSDKPMAFQGFCGVGQSPFIVQKQKLNLKQPSESYNQQLKV